MDSPTNHDTVSSDFSDEDLESHRCTVARCGSVRPYMWVPALHAHPEDIKALDAQNLELRCPLDNGRHDITVADGDQHENVCALPLPRELVHLIIKHLDILSLTTFRRVSKRAMQMVDGTFEYQQIMKRAPQM